MQKAKVGDLIYFDRDYWRVTEVGPQFVDAQKLANGSFFEIYHGCYQIVFSPHAFTSPSDDSIQALAKAVAQAVNGDEKPTPVITGHRIYVGLGDEYAYVGFVPFGKTATIAGSHLIVQDEPERARVGYIIRNFEGQLMTVERVDATCAYGLLAESAREYAAPHGTYTIVKQSSADPIWSIDDARTFRAIIKDYEESAVAAYKRDVSTAELVAMLAKRKGVVEFQGAENPFLATPCTILVIPEDAK